MADEHAYSVIATVSVEYEVDATDAEAAMAIVRAYTDRDLDHPTQALDLVSVDEAVRQDTQ